MRATTITVYNTQKVELFVERLKSHFEVWIVGSLKGARMVLDHHFTHDDLEARLEYANPRDLVWRDALPSEIPTLKHLGAIEMEGTIKRGHFCDYNDPQRDEREADARIAQGFSPSARSFRSVTPHLGSIIHLGTSDKKILNAAKKTMLGQWSDGVVILTFEPNNKFKWSRTDSSRLVGFSFDDAPEWWNFAMWNLHIMNSKTKRGTRCHVLAVNETGLHLWGGINTPENQHRLAHVFRRIGEPVVLDETAREEPGKIRKPPQEMARAASPVSPLFRQLGQSIIKRNQSLAERLKSGLPERQIQDMLNRANVTGETAPLIQFYSWRNGMALAEATPMAETSFFPEDIFQFLDLEGAIEGWKSINRAAEQLQTMIEDTEASLFTQFSGQLFPIFDDSTGCSIAVDLALENETRVVVIEFESEEPVRHAYDSFDDFIRDAIRANETGTHLSCFEG